MTTFLFVLGFIFVVEVMCLRWQRATHRWRLQEPSAEEQAVIDWMKNVR